jgi:hypothetical protein
MIILSLMHVLASLAHDREKKACMSHWSSLCLDSSLIHLIFVMEFSFRLFISSISLKCTLFVRSSVSGTLGTRILCCCCLMFAPVASDAVKVSSACKL